MGDRDAVESVTGITWNTHLGKLAFARQANSGLSEVQYSALRFCEFPEITLPIAAHASSAQGST